jgi:triacylglycerol lipase
MSNLDQFTFTADTTKYDPVNAYWLGNAARLAYSDSAVAQSTAAGWGFDRFRFFDRNDTQAYVAGNAQTIIVAFRGTQPQLLKDWLTDCDTCFCGGSFGRVHQGFQRGLEQVWSEVLATIVQFQDRGQSLWFTGHSLGAALATLAVASLRVPPNDKPVYGLYTFGQPRVGDREFEQRFNTDFKARAFRFVNNNDMVTRVPSRVAGFSHVGTFLYFDRAGDLHDDMGFWYRFVDRVQGSIDSLGHLTPDQIRDHDMADGYLRSLARNVAVNPFAP